ncbi:hypothetical protein GCM10023176_62560 [Micromonospora coerulea]|uniref:Transposase n=1 Tax=Micromonospora coerulea TaxID=47856 RepID=A0ABP8T4Y6_9ACTN
MTRRRPRPCRQQRDQGGRRPGPGPRGLRDKELARLRARVEHLEGELPKAKTATIYLD